MDDGVPIIQNMALLIQNVHSQVSSYFIAEVFAVIFRLGVVKQVAKIKSYDIESTGCHLFVHFDHWFPTTETVLFQLALARALYLDYEIDPRSPWRISRIPNIYEGMQIEANMNDDWTDIKTGRIIKLFINGEMILELDMDDPNPYYKFDAINVRTMEKMPLHIYTPLPYSIDGKRQELKFASRYYYDTEKGAVVNRKEINDNFPDLFATFAKKGTVQSVNELIQNYDGYALYFEKRDIEIKQMFGWDYIDWEMTPNRTKTMLKPSYIKEILEKIEKENLEKESVEKELGSGSVVESTPTNDSTNDSI